MDGITNFNRLAELFKDLLDRQGRVWMRLIGKSMLPFLRSGTLIAVQKTDVKDIHIGDIALFKKGDIAIAHRVIKKVNLDGHIFLRAKSDISFLSEPLISHNELIGKVVAFKRFRRQINIDNFVFRLLGLGAGFLFPFVARAHYTFKSATNYAVPS